MKTTTGKKWSLVLSLVLVMALCLTTFSFPASAQTTEESRTLYYVDAGHLIADGNGTLADRGNWGCGSWIPTATMTEKGYAFPTAPGETNKLYNCFTDQVFAADQVSGKEWGFVAYDGHDWWRHALTGSGVDGFNTVRLIEASDTATLKYIFEVDDDSMVKINVGTRMINGWQPVSFDVKVNGESRGVITGGEKEDVHVFYAKGVLDTEKNKYFVSIEFGNGAGQTVYCNWLEVMTAGDDEGLDAAPYGFVKKGEAPRIYKWDGTYISAAISATEQAKIDNAADFAKVNVTCSYGENNYENVELTVLPKNLLYFIDVGGSGDGKLMLPDAIYSADNKAGVDENAQGTAGWQAFTYDQSCRYDVNWNPMTFKFDVKAGNYGVIVGTYHFNDAVKDRTSYLQINSDEYVEVQASYGVPSITAAETVMAEDGTMTLNFTANWTYTEGVKENYPLVTFLAVYEKEAPAENPGGPADTGDNTPFALLIALMTISAAAFVVLPKKFAR